MSLVIFRNRFAPFKHSHRLCLLAIALGTLQNCSPAPQKKTDNPTPEPSLSTKKTAQESIDQLEIMSTPPQEWRLEIKEGQKDLSSQQYQFKELQWKSKAWQFKSPAAVQEAQHNDSFLFDTIYGTTIPERIALIAHQTTFNSRTRTGDQESECALGNHSKIL